MDNAKLIELLETAHTIDESVRAMGAAAEAIKALQTEVERLGEERDELGIAASHWEERTEEAEAKAKALQAEVERLTGDVQIMMKRGDEFAAQSDQRLIRAEAAEARAERYRTLLKPFARTKALRIFKPPTDEDFRRARQALADGKAQP